MIAPIQVEEKDELLLLRLTLNDKNVVNTDFVSTLNNILDKLKESKQFRAIAITGDKGFFSNGFDPAALVGQDKQQIHNVIGEAFLLCEKLLFENDLPVFACLNGHAMGYGAILALFCDYRFGVHKFGRVGFPEILIGLALPLAPAIMLRHVCGSATARDLALTGKAIKSDEALELGYLDLLFDDEEKMLSHVQKEVKRIAAFPRDVVAINRQNLFFSLKEEIHKAVAIDVASAPDMILTPNGQEGLKSLLENRRPKFV